MPKLNLQLLKTFIVNIATIHSRREKCGMLTLHQKRQYI